MIHLLDTFANTCLGGSILSSLPIINGPDQRNAVLNSLIACMSGNNFKVSSYRPLQIKVDAVEKDGSETTILRRSHSAIKTYQWSNFCFKILLTASNLHKLQITCHIDLKFDATEIRIDVEVHLFCIVKIHSQTTGAQRFLNLSHSNLICSWRLQWKQFET